MPATILASLLAFRHPIAGFLHGIAPRISKLSIGKLALELAPAAELRLDWRIDTGAASFDVRQLSPEWAFDSYADSLLKQLDDPSPIDYVVIDLGTGSSWLSSRLFLFADLLYRMRGVRCFVFLHTVGSRDRCFLGMASPIEIRWRLAREYPALERALILAYAQAFQSPVPIIGEVGAVVASDGGALERWSAGNVARVYLQKLQSPAPTPLQPPKEWTLLGGSQPEPPIYERAVWLTGAEIGRILESVLCSGFIEENNVDNIDRSIQAIAVVRQRGPFVAVVRNQQFDRLVDRLALIEQVALQAVQEGDATRDRSRRTRT
jgi:hypothetical protein